MRGEWIDVGKITKTHGLKGEFKFHPFVDDPDILEQLQRGKLSGPGTGDTPVTVESLRGAGPVLIIKFRELNSIDEAQPFCGRTFSVPRSEFASLPEGEFYWFEVQGLNVYDEDGEFYGRVVEILRTGSNDVYVVHGEDREILLPVIESVVKTIDPGRGKLIFHKVEGLL